MNQSSWQGAGPFEGLVQSVANEVEQLLLAAFEEARERPAVVVAIAAAVAGFLAGYALAARPARRAARSPLQDAAQLVAAILAALGSASLSRRGRSFVDLLASGSTAGRREGLLGDLAQAKNAADLAGLAVRLLENPLVRGYLRATIAARLRRGFAR